jgi:hypothetical protein
MDPMTWPRVRNKVPPRRLHDLEANQNPRNQCWYSIPLDCKNPPEFVLLILQGKLREGFSNEQGGKEKAIRRYLCRSHLSVFQRALIGLNDVATSMRNLNPVTESAIAREDEVE